MALFTFQKNSRNMSNLPLNLKIIKKKFTAFGFPVLSYVGHKKKGKQIQKLKGRASSACLLVFTVCTFIAPINAYGQEIEPTTYQLEIPSTDIEAALFRLARITGKSLIIPSKGISQKHTIVLDGTYSLSDALSTMLKGTNLSGDLTKSGVIVISQRKSVKAQNREETIVVPKKLKKSLLASVSALLFGAAANPALAQEVASADEPRVERDEIIVTASRREQNLQDVPMSVTAINPDELLAAGLTDFSDVVAYTPGFSFVDDGGARGLGTITARGVGKDTLISVVGVYVDDIPMTSSTGFGSGGAAVFFDGLLGDVERVEFLRGPQGTLYGATSVGGAVKYVMRKPTLDEMRGSASVNFSNTKDGGFNHIYSARMSVPLVEDKLGVTLSGFFEENGGFVDRIDVATQNVIDEDANQSESYGFSGDMLFQLSDKLSFRGKGIYQSSDFEGNARVDNDGHRPRFGRNLSTEAHSFNVVDFTTFGGTFEYDLEWATLASVSSIVKSSFNNERDLVSALGDFVDGVLDVQPLGTTTAIPVTSAGSSKKFVQEVRLTSAQNAKLEWILGLYYTNEDTTGHQAATGIRTGLPNFNLADVGFPVEYSEYAAFGNLTYYFTPKLDVTAGVRLSRNETSLNVTASGPFAGPPGLSDVDETVDTWLFTGRYRPNDDMSLYTRIASGYRPATAGLPFVNPVTGQAAEAIVEADSLWSYEVGVKGSFFDGMFDYDAALWYINWQNFQTQNSVGGVSFFLNAEGGIRAKGGEIVVSWKPVDGFSVISTVAHSDSTLSQDEAALAALQGARVPGISKWTATSKARYDFIVGNSLEAYIGGGLRYVGGSPNNYNAAINVTSEGYVLADINMGLARDGVSLGLYVTNLFDDETFTRHNGFLGSANPVRPRTIGAVLSLDF